MNRGAVVAREKLQARGEKAKLAKALGIGQDLVSRWLSGDRVPDTKQRAHLEDLYEIGWRLWDEPLDDAPASERNPTPGKEGAA